MTVGIHQHATQLYKHYTSDLIATGIVLVFAGIALHKIGVLPDLFGLVMFTLIAIATFCSKVARHELYSGFGVAQEINEIANRSIIDEYSSARDERVPVTMYNAWIKYGKWCVLLAIICVLLSQKQHTEPIFYSAFVALTIGLPAGLCAQAFVWMRCGHLVHWCPREDFLRDRLHAKFGTVAAAEETLYKLKEQNLVLEEPNSR